jgi:hypothetical protein
MAKHRRSRTPTARVIAAFSSSHIWASTESKRGLCTFDAYGIFDGLLLPVDGSAPLVAVQITSSSNRSSRLRRLRESDVLPVWLADSSSRAAWLAVTGTRKRSGQDSRPVIRVTVFTLGIGGALIETDLPLVDG